MRLEWLFGPKRAAAPENDWLVAGGRTVRICFVRHRRARRYVLRLRPDGSARVTVPRGGSVAEARRFATKHSSWLERQLLRQASTPRAPQTWHAGSEILFRGEPVRLETAAHGEGDWGVMVALGPGFAAEGALLRW